MPKPSSSLSVWSLTGSLALLSVLCLLLLLCTEAPAVTLSSSTQGLSVSVDRASGSYELTWKDRAWQFAGNIEGSFSSVTTNSGRDNLGSYQQVAFSWNGPQSPMSAEIRLYDNKPLVLVSATWLKALSNSPAPFPRFTRLPQNLHVFSHTQKEFAPPRFVASENCTPWLLFDDQADSLIISPASHFMVASMFGDGQTEIASGCNRGLAGLPAGFSQQTLLAVGTGINRMWDAWGQAMIDLQGAKRPSNDADTVLKYLGYWTDNGAAYYYNYDADKGYAGTLQALVERYRKEQIPLRYLQLDSWWYSKSTTGADGKSGAAKKSQKLPEGEWNRYGGTLEYSAHKFLFPDGLDAFQRTVNLPLVTHSRWIDPASPYHQKYKISGVAAIDPKWWDDIAAYLKKSGVITYEQDWLDRIYAYSPAFSTNLETGEAFLDNMSRACQERGISLQYCMPYACYFLQGCRYQNLTTIRTCTDRFGPNRWNDFLYTSRLASALGIWPWADVYLSRERDNTVLSTLSAGPVGIGDAMGAETTTNLFRAVRADGVIVKPDAPIVPTDRSYIADANNLEAPLIASTFTEHNGLKTVYVFACARPKMPGGEARFSSSDFGLDGPIYVYDYESGIGQRLEAAAEFSATVRRDGTAFYILAPVGKGGMAFLGDAGKFVSTGKQRIASMQDETGRLTARVVFAEAEKSVVLHGYSAVAPKASARHGKVGPVHFDPVTRHFELEASPESDTPPDRTTGDPIRLMTVVLEDQAKLQALK